jgi:hypothetical protein
MAHKLKSENGKTQEMSEEEIEEMKEKVKGEEQNG